MKVRRAQLNENGKLDLIPVKAKMPYSHWVLDNETYTKMYNDYKRVPELEEQIKKLTAYTQRMESEIRDYKEKRLTLDKIIAVSRERANKDRKIKDKKNNPGYVLISSSRVMEKIFNTKVPVWKSVIQTPFFSELDYYEFMQMYDRDYGRDEFFNKVGIGEFKEKPTTRDIEDHKEAFWYKYDYNANYRAGFWEVSVYHSMEIRL